MKRIAILILVGLSAWFVRTASTTTPESSAPVPKFVPIDPLTNSYSVLASWAPAVAAEGYVCYVGTKSGVYDRSNRVAATSTSFVLTDDVERYFFAVKATNWVGDSPYSRESVFPPWPADRAWLTWSSTNAVAIGQSVDMKVWAPLTNSPPPVLILFTGSNRFFRISGITNKPALLPFNPKN